MLHEEFSWQTPDGLKLFAQLWQPKTTPVRAVIALVHGLGEHSARYQHVAQWLTENRYAVVAYDQRGHGRSEGLRGHTPSYDTTMDDIRHLIKEAVARFPNLPCFLYGHSLGGNMVLYYTLSRRPAGISGVIATSPGLGTGVPVPAWKTAIGKLMYRIQPAMIMENGLDLKYLSHDPAVQAAYISDPLVHSKISARMGIDVLTSGDWIIEHADQFPLPLLLMQGDAERIVDPARTARFAENVPGDFTYKVWEGLYHELHNENEKQQVLEFIRDWLDQHTPS